MAKVNGQLDVQALWTINNPVGLVTSQLLTNAADNTIAVQGGSVCIVQPDPLILASGIWRLKGIAGDTGIPCRVVGSPHMISLGTGVVSFVITPQVGFNPTFTFTWV
jgi:hypothetical protein